MALLQVTPHCLECYIWFRYKVLRFVFIEDIAISLKTTAPTKDGVLQFNVGQSVTCESSAVSLTPGLKLQIKLKDVSMMLQDVITKLKLLRLIWIHWIKHWTPILFNIALTGNRDHTRFRVFHKCGVGRGWWSEKAHHSVQAARWWMGSRKGRR